MIFPYFLPPHPLIYKDCHNQHGNYNWMQNIFLSSPYPHFDYQDCHNGNYSGPTSQTPALQCFYHSVISLMLTCQHLHFPFVLPIIHCHSHFLVTARLIKFRFNFFSLQCFYHSIISLLLLLSPSTYYINSILEKIHSSLLFTFSLDCSFDKIHIRYFFYLASAQLLQLHLLLQFLLFSISFPDYCSSQLVSDSYQGPTFSGAQAFA